MSEDAKPVVIAVIRYIRVSARNSFPRRRPPRWVVGNRAGRAEKKGKKERRESGFAWPSGRHGSQQHGPACLIGMEGLVFVLSFFQRPSLQGPPAQTLGHRCPGWIAGRSTVRRLLERGARKKKNDCFPRPGSRMEGRFFQRRRD